MPFFQDETLRTPTSLRLC